MKSSIALMLVILVHGPLAQARPPLSPQQASPPLATAQTSSPQTATPQGQAPAAPTAAPAQPPPAQTNPAAQTSQASPSATPPKPAGAQPLSPDQLNDLVRKIYNSSYRITDLVSLLNSDKWTMSDSDRKFFSETLDSMRAGLKNLEEARSRFSGQPQNLALGDRVVAALGAALPDVDAVGRAVSQYAGPTLGVQYKQTEDQLAGLGRSLQAHLGAVRASLTEPSPPGAAPSNAPQVEIVKAPSTPPPATTVEEVGYMQPDQVKALLHRIYVATFRVNDLLSQVRQGQWKVPEPVRDYFNLRVAALQADSKALEAARSEFEEQPDNAYLGYRVCEAIPAVVSDLRSVLAEIAQFGGPPATAPFDQPGQWIEQSRVALRTYVDFMLRNRSQVIRTYEANLAACQNTLNFAMRGENGPAHPMEPVHFVRPLQSAKIRRKQAEEAAEHATEGASSGAAVKTKEAGEGNAEKSTARKKGKGKAKRQQKSATTATQ